jgi:hypothetical protein
MSMDWSVGSRAQLVGTKTGFSNMMVNPILIAGSATPPAGAFIIAGNGHPNRPPQPVISYLNAASLRIVATLAGGGVSASFDQVIELGKIEDRGDFTSSSGAVIPSLAKLWRWAIRSPETEHSIPDPRTRFDYVAAVGDGEESLTFQPYLDTPGYGVFYRPSLDLWEIRFSLLSMVVTGTDPDVDRAGAEVSPMATSGAFSTGFTAFGADLPLLLEAGSSVTGAITVETWLPVY